MLIEYNDRAPCALSVVSLEVVIVLEEESIDMSLFFQMDIDDFRVIKQKSHNWAINLQTRVAT